jgi:glutathione S-transferase
LVVVAAQRMVVRMKIYGHPWSTNTRKVLMTLAERNAEAELVVVMLPKGEHHQPTHLARHPFAKVPVLDDDGFVLYEARAICCYLDRKLGPKLVPSDTRAAARMDQWVNIADSYLVPHAAPVIVESMFRRYLGGEQNTKAIADGRAGLQTALDVADRWLAENPYLAGQAFSYADIHWMPFVDYLVRVGLREDIERRRNLGSWWGRVSERPTWKKVARTGPQPDDSAA